MVGMGRAAGTGKDAESVRALSASWWCAEVSCEAEEAAKDVVAAAPVLAPPPPPIRGESVYSTGGMEAASRQRPEDGCSLS